MNLEKAPDRTHGIVLIFLVVTLVFFLLFFCLSPINLTPGANTGELLSISYCLGIAHPTGYPIFSTFYHLISIIPFSNPVLRSGLIQSVLAGLTFGIIFLLLQRLKINFYLIVFGLISFAMNPLVWEIIIIPEVHCMSVFLYSIYLFAFFRYYGKTSSRWLYLSFFIFGLTLSNHATAIIFTPFFIYSIFHNFTLRRTTMASIFLTLPLSSYIYLPIRASQNAVIKWGTPNTFIEFINHLLGRDFHSSFFQKISLIQKFDSLSSGLLQFEILIFICSSLIWFFSKANFMKDLKYIFFSSLVLNYLIVLFYNIHDIESYILPSLLIFTLFGLIFLNFSIQKLKTRFLNRVIPLILFFLAIFSGLQENLYYWDFKNKVSYHLYAKMLETSLPHSATFVFKGDNPMNSLSYFNLIENKFDHVRIVDIDRNLLPFGLNTSTAFEAISFRYPQIRDQFYPHGIVYLRKILNQKKVNPLSSKIFEFLDEQSINLDQTNKYEKHLLSEILINRAEYECECGQWEKGRFLYFRAAEIAQNDIDVIVYIASLSARRGFLELSSEIVKNLINDGLEAPILIQNYAYYCWLKGNNISDALELIDEQMIAKKPKGKLHEYYAKLAICSENISLMKTLISSNLVESLNSDLRNSIRYLESEREDKMQMSEQESIWNAIKSDCKILSKFRIEEYWRNYGFEISLFRYYSGICHELNAENAIIYQLERFKSSTLQTQIIDALINLHHQNGNHSRIKEIQSNLNQFSDIKSF